MAYREDFQNLTPRTATTCWALAKSSSVSAQSAECQLVWTNINSVSRWLFPLSDKVTLSIDSSWKMVIWLFVPTLWCRPRTRAHNKFSDSESSWIFLFMIFQPYISKLHLKQRSTKVLSDLSLDRPSFLVIASAHNAYMKQLIFLQLVLIEWKRMARNSQASP